MASDATIAGCVAVLSEAFGKPPTANKIEAYRLGLCDLPDDHIKAATQAALRSSKFMPSPAELRELAGEAKPEDAAERAWGQFSDAVTRYGAYKTLVFEDRVINAVVRSFGGLEVVIEYSDEEWQFFRARFLKAYAARRRTGVGDEEGAPLLGYADRINEGDANRVVIEAPKMVPLLSQNRPAPNRITARAAQ